jgi:competence protein ComEC
MNIKRGKRNPNILSLISLLFIAIVYIFVRLSSTFTESGVTVHFIDVGQGDSILIETTGGSVLIDAGEASSGAAVIDYLRGEDIKALDYCVATHPHSDHIGGLAAVIGEFQVRSLMLPDITHTSATFERLLETAEQRGLTLTVPKPGERFELGGAVFTVLGPNSASYAELNNYSVVLRMEYENTSFLFAGDAEALAEAELLDGGYALNSDILKVGHHGSSSSTSQRFLEAVAPTAAVISVGANNDYGHPNVETIERLAESGVLVYRTDKEGNIAMHTDGMRITEAK